MRPPIPLPYPESVSVLTAALKHGRNDVEVYIVGGAVRDFLIEIFHGKPEQYNPKDVDLTTNLSEEEILAQLRSAYAQSLGIVVSEKQSVDTFGVVFASVGGSPTVEVAPFRVDVGSADGRRPESVRRGTIYEDAMRRDLTVNNLYYNMDRGVILDFNRDGLGIEDVKNRVARMVGDPFQRFEEDKLRVLRLVRFFSRFNDGLITQHADSETLRAILHYKDLPSHGISPERIMTEFLLGLKQCLRPSSYLRNYADLGLFNSAFPGMQVEVNDIGRISKEMSERVIVAYLLRRNENVRDRLNELKYPNDFSDAVQFLVDATVFEPEDVVDVLRERERRLVRTGKKKLFLTPDEEAHNRSVWEQSRSDLLQMSLLFGDRQTRLHVLVHLSDYQPTPVDGEKLVAAGFVGKEIGLEQRRLMTEEYRLSVSDHLKKHQR